MIKRVMFKENLSIGQPSQTLSVLKSESWNLEWSKDGKWLLAVEKSHPEDEYQLSTDVVAFVVRSTK